MSHDPVGALLSDVRRRLLLRGALRAAAVALLSVCAAVALLLALDLVVQLPVDARRGLRWLPAFLVFPPVIPMLRAWAHRDARRIALLVDERGALGNVVSTYQNPNAHGPVADAFRRRATGALRSLDVASVVPLDVGRLWASTIGAALLAIVMLIGSGGRDVVTERWWDVSKAEPSARPVTASVTAEPEPPPTLGAIEFVVHAPTYSGLPDVRGVAGDVLAALPGSIIEIRGGGSARDPELTVAIVGGGVVVFRPADTGWMIEWSVAPDDRGMALTVSDADRILEQRVIPLRLLRDRPPVVQLTAPTEDLVLARSVGTISIVVRASDDYGVADLRLHWVRSRGSGESFDFDEGEWAWDRIVGTASSRIATLSLSLDALALEAGDVLHVRATATDGNSVTGPGIGVSATRQIRISSDDDLVDVTTLVGFPIEREREPLLSQRMIILLTEELRDSALKMDSVSLREASTRIANEQARLRGRIGEQIFSRATGAMQDPESHLDFEEGVVGVFLDELQAAVEQGPVIDPETGIASIANVDIPAHEHDSDPIISINRSLLTVYNYMWDAERELRTARLDPSLVPQRLALDELQRVRDSERVFARGRVRVAPIDVPAARGTGAVDDVSPAPRSSVRPAPSVEAKVVAELDALLASARTPTGRTAAIAISSLALDLLQLATDPMVSEILVEAAALAETGDPDATRDGLRRARRMLRTPHMRTGNASILPPATLAAARYLDAGSGPSSNARGGETTVAPFVFATLRYESGDWDSAPLVPNNLIHSLAQYTDLEVSPEGVVVDLASPNVFEYPFLYLTGHLPVFFSEAEGRNLVDFVERGGFVFIDDHNHDIDGAFHRSVTAELRRLFGSDRLTPVPNDHELYSTFFEFEDGPPITGHELSGWGDGLIHRELFQVEVADRIGVLYSNKDYSSEWSYHSDNKRFLAVDNTRFGVNVLVYALSR